MTAQLRGAAVLYAALCVTLVAGAVGGRVIGGLAALPLGASRSGGGLFVSVAATNGRLIGVLALAALLVARVPEWRGPLDVAIGGLLAVNALAVGAAIGVGGHDVARSLAHLPFEWAALAAGATLYAGARNGALSVRVGASWVAVAVALVVLAACVEVWAPPVG
jgi:hypothetical protein